jgi:hypothetical protein
MVYKDDDCCAKELSSFFVISPIFFPNKGSELSLNHHPCSPNQLSRQLPFYCPIL